MNLTIRLQLSVMMFLQFFVWGSWYVIMFTYLSQGLQFPGDSIAWAYATTAIAAIISPFFVGMVADKFFPAQYVLAAMHLVGGILLYASTMVTSTTLFFWVLLLHTLCYMPTLALVNAISFHQMSDPAHQFPGIRVIGTIGWIAAGLLISLLEILGAENIEATSLPFKIGAGVSLLLGLYCLTLPNTPPKSQGEKVTVRDILGLDALGLLKDPPFLVFTLGSLLICIPLQFYYGSANGFFNEIGMEQVAAKQTMGQMSEIFFLLVMPFFFVRLGVKYMLLVGMLAWVTRYFLFAYGDNGSLVWMLYLGIILHGICFDFFFVTGQIYVDKKAPKAIQASAQGFIALITYGVGMLLGTRVMGMVLEKYTTTAADGTVSHDWPSIWMVPAIMALVVMIGFALLFRDKTVNGKTEVSPETAEAAPPVV